MAERTDHAPPAAGAECKYPGCTRAPEPANGRPGRPPEYCDDPDHDPMTAWRERKRLDAEAGGAAVPALAQTGQPVTMTRATGAELVREMRALADRQDALSARLAEAAAIIGDPGAAEAEIEAVRAAAEQRATTAESARATAEQLAGAATRDREQADTAAAAMDTARAQAEDRARQAAEQLATAQVAHAAELTRIREDAQTAIARARQEAETAIARARQEATEATAAATRRAETAEEAARQQADSARAEAAGAVAAAEAARDDAQDRAQQAEQRAAAADARATAAAEEAGRARQSADRQLGQLTERLAPRRRGGRGSARGCRPDPRRRRPPARGAARGLRRPGAGPRGVPGRPPAARRTGRAGPGAGPRGDQATPRCRRLKNRPPPSRRPQRPVGRQPGRDALVSPARPVTARTRRTTLAGKDPA